MFIHKNIIFVQNVTLSQNIVKNSGIIIVQKSKKAPSFEDASRFWRRERDSNPRVLAHKLISSQPRYDHFDISP